jgi:hypothetical protein
MIREGYAPDAWFANPRHTRGLSLNAEGFWTRPHPGRAGPEDPTIQIVVPNSPALKKLIFHEHHDSRMAGHPGITRTLEKITRTFWWPAVARDVEEYVRSCASCQRNKARAGATPGLLQPLPIPDKPWDSVSLDLITGLPRTPRGFDAAVVFVDRLTKMTRFAPTRTTVTAEDLATIFHRTVVSLHGMPQNLVSDRDSKFTSKFWRALTAHTDTRLLLSTSYHPQTDGQTERMNRVLEETLRHYIDPSQTNWDQLLPMAEFAINSSINASTGETPFFLNYGRHPRTPAVRSLDFTVPAAASTAQTIENAIARAKACLNAAQQRQKAYHDQRRADLTLTPGQQVLLSTKNIKVKTGGPRKLMPKWLGPFPVRKMVGAAAAELELPPSLRIHPTFHVSLLRPFRGDAPDSSIGPVAAFEQGVPYYTVERILTHRDRKIGRKTVREYLVKWKDYTDEHNSWEPDANFTDSLAQDAYWASRRVGDVAS